MKTLELDSLAPIYGGMCLSRLDGVVFIKGAIPGEKVLAELKETKRDYSIAEAIEILNGSSDRVTPRCDVFGMCGGCHYQHISYIRQLSIKEEIIADCLRRIAKKDIPLAGTIYGSQWNYRRKAQFKLSHGGNGTAPSIGFYREGTRDVVAVGQCALLNDTLNRFLAKIRGARFLSGVSEVHMLTGKTTVAFIKGPEVDEAKLDFLLDIGLSGAVGTVSTDNRQTYAAGEPFCLLPMGDDSCDYAVSPQGFFQSNWELNRILVETARESLGDLRGKKVIDIYGGAGNFSLELSKTAKEITIVEENPHSVADGQRNIAVNNLTNVSYITKSFEKLREDKTYDAAIVDPPRIGLTSAAVEKLLSLRAEKIAYISCNPSTFARDAAKLQDRYTLSSVRLIDMFPNTYHCEVLGIFQAA